MVNFDEILSSTKLYNFHTHTQFCDGRAVMEDFVMIAIEQGFEDIGFTPHSPIPYYSPCNMKSDDVPAYLNEINRLKDLYGDKINIYKSMEIDFLDNWGPANEYFKNIPLDYRIGSVHFIPSFKDENEYIDVDGCFENFKEKMSLYFDNDIKSVVESFYNQTLKMIENGGFDIIGHFDKIGYNSNQFQPGIEDETWYRKVVKQTFDAIMDNNYIIEVNTKAFEKHNRFFPGERYFKWLKDYNAPILVNSDTHFPDLINSGRLEAIKLL